MTLSTARWLGATVGTMVVLVMTGCAGALERPVGPAEDAHPDAGRPAAGVR